MRALPGDVSGYVGSDGVMYAEMPDYLVAEVRERYALGKVPVDELEPRIEAALAGDYAQATDSPFRPAQLTYSWR